MKYTYEKKPTVVVLCSLFFALLLFLDITNRQQFKKMDKEITQANKLINEYNASCVKLEKQFDDLFLQSLMSETINDTVIQYQDFTVPFNIDTSFKAYMDYKTLSDTTSKQYELQQQAYTDILGFRKIGQDCLVALGTYYSETCGERFLITLDSGFSFTVMTGDIKMDKHTNKTNQYTPMKNGNANVIEFIIDESKMNKTALKLGDISNLGFKGNIIRIQKIIN